MNEGPLNPNEVVVGAALRLADHLAQLRQAHDDHGIAPGPHDDLAGHEFMAAAERIYRMTLSAEYLTRVGLSFGAVEVLMQALAGLEPSVPASERWTTVHRYFSTSAALYAPGYHERFDELPSLVLATQATPAITRYDLLAALASRAGVIRLFDAASWVVETASELPVLDSIDLDPMSLSALTVSAR